jgi:acetyl-CoA carboxylase alpha subunit
MISYLEFEKPVAELENRIAELRSASAGDDVDISGELERDDLRGPDSVAKDPGRSPPGSSALPRLRGARL